MQYTLSLHNGVQAVPNKPFTIFGSRVRTYAEAEDRIARFAGALREFGVADGERVAILGLNSDRYLESFYAVPWAGGVINPVNIRWSPREVALSLNDCDTRILLVDDTFFPMVDRLRTDVPELTTIIYIGEGDTPDGALSYEELITQTSPISDARRSDEDLFGILYTGGTTGTPKGVMLPHRAVLSSAFSMAIAAGSPDRGGRVLHAAPMFHIADTALGTLAAATLSTHVIIPAFAPDAALAAVEEHGVTSMFLVPTMVQMLLDHPKTAEADLTKIKVLLYGASPMSEAVLVRAQSAFPNAAFMQAYGMTELAPTTAVLTPEDHADPSLLRSAGRATPLAQVKIVDPTDQELPRGEIGEIIARGDHMMTGYWNRPEQTAEAMRGGWMHTGDAGYMNDDGYVFVVDRVKDMIITGGENVYSVEVENALARHPAVASAAVVGVPDDKWGERVHAYVILRPGQSVELSELQEFCREYIAGYKIPRSMEFIEEFPMSGAGKILKRDLREMAQEA